jgi:hypothetical protein
MGSQSGGFGLEDLVHDLGFARDDGLELVSIDGLGGVGSGMSDEIGDVPDPTP